MFLFGWSNGASTIISLLAAYPQYASCIQGALLFAPYADIYNVFPKFNTSPGRKFVRKSMGLFSQTFSDSYGSPLSFFTSQRVPKDIPLLFVHACDDRMVPYSNYELFKAAAQHNGYTQLAFYSLSRGGHNFYKVQDNQVLNDLKMSFCTLVEAYYSNRV